MSSCPLTERLRARYQQLLTGQKRKQRQSHRSTKSASFSLSAAKCKCSPIVSPPLRNKTRPIDLLDPNGSRGIVARFEPAPEPEGLSWTCIRADEPRVIILRAGV